MHVDLGVSEDKTMYSWLEDMTTSINKINHGPDMLQWGESTSRHFSVQEEYSLKVRDHHMNKDII